MADKTKIEWTDATWNPIRGCSRVSEGCRNCYAESVAYRFSGEGQAYEGLVRIGADGQRRREWNGEVKFIGEVLLQPLRWKRPRRIFVNSMSDLFHPSVTDEMRDRIFAVMALCPQHTFQVLTKRPERMLHWFTKHFNVRSPGAREMIFEISHKHPGFVEGREWVAKAANAFDKWPLPNVWLGVSGEDQRTATERAWLLLQTPAAVRFLSAEPLLGPVDLNKGELLCKTWRKGATIGRYLDWVIAGGESGIKARPMHPDWVRGLRDECVAADVPFFFKQWGEFSHSVPAFSSREPELYVCADGRTGSEEEALAGGRWQGMWRVGKAIAGDLLDDQQWHQFPEVRA